MEFRYLLSVYWYTSLCEQTKQRIECTVSPINVIAARRWNSCQSNLFHSHTSLLTKKKTVHSRSSVVNSVQYNNYSRAHWQTHHRSQYRFTYTQRSLTHVVFVFSCFYFSTSKLRSTVSLQHTVVVVCCCEHQNVWPIIMKWAAAADHNWSLEPIDSAAFT